MSILPYERGYYGKRLINNFGQSRTEVYRVIGDHEEPLVNTKRLSPSGFNWGYGGTTGSAELSLSILTDFLRDEDLAYLLHDFFLEKIVLGFDQDSFAISFAYLFVLVQHQIFQLLGSNYDPLECLWVALSPNTPLPLAVMAGTKDLASSKARRFITRHNVPTSGLKVRKPPKNFDVQPILSGTLPLIFI